MNPTIKKTEEEWKKELTPEQYNVLREKGTEAPFSGAYHAEHGKGIYTCAACGAKLFSSDTKFDSGTGWPSFDQPINRQNIKLREDTSAGMRRTEVICKNCGSHLGHLFNDGPKNLPDGRQATGERFCINSCALKMKK